MNSGLLPPCSLSHTVWLCFGHTDSNLTPQREGGEPQHTVTGRIDRMIVCQVQVLSKAFTVTFKAPKVGLGGNTPPSARTLQPIACHRGDRAERPRLARRRGSGRAPPWAPRASARLVARHRGPAAPAVAHAGVSL